MNVMTPTREQREAKLEGMGCKRKRVEDVRFTQGKGQYVDDVKLPGMLHGDFVRSPYPHARIKSINTEKALAVKGVLAVITAETLKTVNLAWIRSTFQQIGRRGLNHGIGTGMKPYEFVFAKLVCFGLRNDGSQLIK